MGENEAIRKLYSTREFCWGWGGWRNLVFKNEKMKHIKKYGKGQQNSEIKRCFLQLKKNNSTSQLWTRGGTITTRFCPPLKHSLGVRKVAKVVLR